jgi:hypothetical protein
MNMTITKAVVAAITAFASLVEAKMPGTSGQWWQLIAESVAAGAIVWYVPNTPKSGGGS